MKNKFFDTTEYLNAVSEIGKAVHQKSDKSMVKELFDNLAEKENEAEIFCAFKKVREDFSLSYLESLILCEALYAATEFIEVLSISEMMTYSDDVIEGLSPIFTVSSDKFLINKNVLNFLLNRVPSPSNGITVDFCMSEEECVLSEFSENINSKINSYKGNQSLILSFTGEKESGKLFLSKRLAKSLNASLIIVDGEIDDVKLSDAIILSALYDGLICLDNFKSINKKHLNELLDYVKILLILSDYSLSRNDLYGKTFIDFKIPTLNTELKYRAFQIFLDKNIITNDVDLLKISQSYSLTAGQIKAISEKLSFLNKLDNRKLDKKTILNAIKEENFHGLNSGINLLSSEKTFDDLILPDEQKNQLKNICSFYSQREKVFEDWNFKKKITYGKGISMLFYGASGTGKTMAAQVMANEMGLELYRIDISQLISKYIGETQKNIGEIFDKAQKTDCVLFFDEADALFSKRSDVSDSQDKYSNAEIAYLLQKTEQYSGVTILATNLFQNFDEAFRRRITFMVNFPMPDKTLRLFLWKGIFPQEAPLENLDYDYLAENFELSGAAIKGAALYAAYLAALEEKNIGMEQIVSGIKNEYAKLGKSIDSRLKLKLQQFS